MILYCCSVFDSATGAYGRPFFVPSRAFAIRVFIDEVNRAAEDNPLYKHREDHHLAYLFTVDDNTGQVQDNLPETLLRGKDVQTS